MDSRDYPEAYLREEEPHATDTLRILRVENAALKAELAAAESLRAGQQKFYVGAVADAKRYRWLREFLPSDDESWDDALVAAHTPEELDAVIDDAIAKEQS